MAGIRTCEKCGNSHWSDVECPACNPPEDVKTKLIKISAGLIVNGLSEDAEDYPKSMPKSVLKEIKKHNDLMKNYSIQISDIVKNY